MRIVTGWTLIVFIALGASLAKAQEASPQLLDGTELEYTYTDGGAVVLSFYDGKLKYRWTAGQFAGTEVAALVYKSRRIGDELYLVSWHDVDNLNFVTLVINLQQNVLHSSAVVGYGTDREVTLFDGAIIERVNRGG